MLETRRGGATVAPASRPTVTVDVVVVAYNSRDSLRSCIEPLVRLPWASVTVVDNACPEHSSEVVADLPARIVESSRNGGFAYGCNLGAAAGSAEFVLLLNPDAELDERSLGALVDALRADPQLAAVGPRTIDEAGELAVHPAALPASALDLRPGAVPPPRGAARRLVDDAVRDLDAYERPGMPEWVSGCCVLLRRSAFESASGLDEGFFLYAEETDLFRRLAAAGWRVGYEPRAVASHIGQGSVSADTTEHFRAHSRVRYARKHHGALVAFLEGLGLALGNVTHAAAWITRPARARGHLDAARAALRATHTVGDTL